MKRESKNSLALYLILSVLSGILLAFSYSLHPSIIAAWLAPIPILLVAIKVTPKQAFIWGSLTGLIASLSLFLYLSELSGVFVAILLSLMRAGQWALIIWLVSFASKHLSLPLQLFVYPLAIVSLELIISLLSPHGSGGSLVYSQMDFLAILQLASLGGSSLIVFIFSLFASSIAVMISYGKQAIKSIVIAVVCILVSFSYGIINLTNLQAQTDTLKVTLLASDEFSGVPEDWQSVWQDYRQALISEQGQDTDLILLPEKIMKIVGEDIQAWQRDVQALAQEGDFAVIVGVDERQASQAYNRAYYFTEDGQVEVYDKRHMIPGFESHFSVGEGNLTVDGLGLAICKDMDFPSTIRSYSDINYMLVPAWDFDQDAWFHSRMAILRGVENGWPVIRSARRGFLTVANAQGQVLAETESQGQPMARLNYELPISNQKTLYGQLGDIFAYISLLLLLFIMGYLIIVTFKK